MTPPSTSPCEPLVHPPRFLARWYTWALAAAVLPVPFFVTIPTGLRKHPVIGPLGDQLHIPLLGAVMLVIYWKGPLRGWLWGSAAAAAVVGALIEFFQIFAERAPLLHDWYLDLVGIGIVLGFLLWRGAGSKPGLVLMTLLLFYVPWNLRDLPADIRAREIVVRSFPLLDGFENPHTRILWGETDEANVSFTAIDDGPQGPTSVLLITGATPETWPGSDMAHFPFNWSKYNRLMVRVRHTGPDALEVGFRLHVADFIGRREDLHFTQDYRATSRWQVFTMPLAGRTADHSDYVIDMSDIEKVYIYLTRPPCKTTLQVDEVWLE